MFSCEAQAHDRSQQTTGVVTGIHSVLSNRRAGPARDPLARYRCRRCASVVTEDHPDAQVALRRAVESGQLATRHACPDGASGLAELVGDQTGAAVGRETGGGGVTEHTTTASASA